jgi:hypothetical protein
MRPQILMDFARAGFDRRARVIRASGGTRRNQNGIWQEVPANTARLHWSQDGTALGLLMEPTRTNLMINPRMGPAGEAAIPTNYSTVGSDTAITSYLAQSVVMGVEGRRVLISGTASVPISRILSTFGISVPEGPAVFSRFAAFLAGWGGAAAVPRQQVSSFFGANITPTPTLLRYSLPFTVPAGASSFVASINPQVSAGAAVNLDLFQGWDQLEAGLYATTPSLPATTGSSTRAAESMEALLADFGVIAGTEGTLLIAGRAAGGLQVSGGAQRAIQIDAGSDANRIRIDRLAGRQMRAEVVVGDVSQGTATSAGTVADSGDFVAVLGYSKTGMALSLSGAAVVEAAIGDAPTPTRVVLGDWGGTIERWALWPTRLSNAQIQTAARQGPIA